MLYESSHGHSIAIFPLWVCAAFINSNVLARVACPQGLVEVGPEQYLTLSV
jgi:hypothetical protein